MNSRNKFLVIVSMVGFTAYANAGPASVTPALAACSKALIATLAKSDTLPAYTVKAPSAFVSEMIDPNAFTVVAKHSKTKALLAKAACKATTAGEIVSFKTLKIS